MAIPIHLKGGSYQSRSLIANAQRAINLIPEINPEETDPEAPVTHYPRPGLLAFGAAGIPPTPGRGRGLYRASNGDLYACVEDSVYYIDPTFNFVFLGKIAANGAPVSFADNGISNGQSIVLVDGTTAGYQINMVTRAFSKIIDGTGLFVGADKVQYFDTFFTFNQPGTNNWYSSLSLSVSFNALDIAAKGTYPDQIQSIIACQRIMWLVGQLTAEPWFNAGDPIFPFEEMPGQFVPHGTISKYSVATSDVNAFWLSQDADGKNIVLMTEGYAAKRISTHALESEWLGYQTVSDAIAYTYQQGGHTFYVLHFPTADKTWGYDLATKQWHQRASIDGNGVLHRERVAFHAFAYGKNIGMDWQTGQIYELNQDTYTDNSQPIVYIRSFPHVVDGLRLITVSEFVLDMETGQLAGIGEQDEVDTPFDLGFSSGFGPRTINPAPMVSLRVSKDGGATFGNAREKALLSAGHYRSLLRWRQLGRGRDWVFEVSWASPMKTALQGAFLEAIKHTS